MKDWSATTGAGGVLTLALLASAFTDIHPIVWVLVVVALVTAVCADLVRARTTR